MSETGKRIGDQPADEAANFIVCPVCGQAFDKRDLQQVMRHMIPGHEPEERAG